MREPKVGENWGRGKDKKKIREVIPLSNGWYVIKTDNSKSKRDFKVKVIFSLSPQHSMTPKHAHFSIDFYGKFCSDQTKAKFVLQAIEEVWGGSGVSQVLKKYTPKTSALPGYPLEYILHALNWILDQEDINFTKRSDRKQKEINEICKRAGVKLLPNRMGSHLAVSLFCDIYNGSHPVEALLKGNLHIVPIRRKGT
jgi:hypothetical protein